MIARDAAAERALLVMDLVVGGLSREGAEAKVAAFETAHRAQVLCEATEAVMVRAEQTQDMKARIGLGVAHYVLTEMADAAPNSKEQQR